MLNKHSEDEEALKAARRFLSAYASSHSLLKAFGAAAKGNQELEMIYRELEVDRDMERPKLPNKHMDDLIRIVLFGIKTGINVEKSVALFAGNLEFEIKRKNRLKAKTGSLQTLTYIGLGIFFPLFSGISATILSSSFGTLSRDAGAAENSLMLASIAYIPIVLYLASAFSHPERNFLQNISSFLPYFVLASLIMFITHGYLANIL